MKKSPQHWKSNSSAAKNTVFRAVQEIARKALEPQFSARGQARVMGFALMTTMKHLNEEQLIAFQDGDAAIRERWEQHVSGSTLECRAELQRLDGMLAAFCGNCRCPILATSTAAKCGSRSYAEAARETQAAWWRVLFEPRQLGGSQKLGDRDAAGGIFRRAGEQTARCRRWPSHLSLQPPPAAANDAQVRRTGF